MVDLKLYGENMGFLTENQIIPYPITNAVNGSTYCTWVWSGYEAYLYIEEESLQNGWEMNSKLHNDH